MADLSLCCAALLMEGYSWLREVLKVGALSICLSRYKYLRFGYSEHSAQLRLLATYVTSNIALHHESFGK